MEDLLARIWENLGGRVGGPLTFRLILQPLVAIVFAIRAGLQDARTGRPPYFWTILTSPGDRLRLLREGWKAVARVFVLAAIIDAVYQVMVFRWVYPFEVLLVWRFSWPAFPICWSEVPRTGSRRRGGGMIARKESARSVRLGRPEVSLP